MKLKQTILTITALSGAVGIASAQGITLDFNTKKSPVIGGDLVLLGEGSDATNVFLSDRFENYTSTSFEIQNIPVYGTLTVTTATSGTGNLNVTNGGLAEGVSGLNISGESLSFTFSEDVEIYFLDFNAITESESVELLIDTNSLGTFQLNTIIANIANFTTPSSVDASISLGQGHAFVIKHTSGEYNLERLAFTVVPEPSTFALLSGIGALGFVTLRRRN